MTGITILVGTFGPRNTGNSTSHNHTHKCMLQSDFSVLFVSLEDNSPSRNKVLINVFAKV